MKEEDKILTDAEQKRAIRCYSYGWGYKKITDCLIATRNMGLSSILMREVGRAISKHYQKQSYPIEFYGKVEEGWK